MEERMNHSGHVSCFCQPSLKTIMPILGNFPQSESSYPRKEFLIPLPVICRCPRIWYYVSPNETKNSFENKVMWRSSHHLESMLWKQWLQLDSALGRQQQLEPKASSVQCHLCRVPLCCVCGHGEDGILGSCPLVCSVCCFQLGNLQVWFFSSCGDSTGYLLSTRKFVFKNWVEWIMLFATNNKTSRLNRWCWCVSFTKLWADLSKEAIFWIKHEVLLTW